MATEAGVPPINNSSTRDGEKRVIMDMFYRNMLIQVPRCVGVLDGHVSPLFAPQRLVRSLLCTRITIPSAESVSNSVLRAVLRRDTDELVLASNRKRLKGAATALTADERREVAKFSPYYGSQR